MTVRKGWVGGGWGDRRIPGNGLPDPNDRTNGPEHTTPPPSTAPTDPLPPFT